MAEGSNFVDSSDSVLISDLLYFVRYKLKNTALSTVVSICHSFYTDEEYVFDEKKKFYESIGESKQCSQRRSDTKRQKNLEDICTTMARRDSRGEFLPKFASLNLGNIPMGDDGNPSLGQILASLNDLRRVMVTTDMLKKSLDEMKVNIPLSYPQHAQATSSPPNPEELTPPFSTSSDSSSAIQSAPQSVSPAAPPVALPSAPISAPLSAPPHSTSATAAPPPVSSATSPEHSSAPMLNAIVGNTSVSNQFTAPRPPTGNQPATAPKGNRGRAASKNRWKENQHSRDSSRPRTIIGKSVRDGLTSVKGADLTTNRYIGRWDNNVTTDGVKEFITNQNVTVVELEELPTKHGRFKSFRLRVKKSDLKMIEDANFWPEGILLSPFFRGKENLR